MTVMVFWTGIPIDMIDVSNERIATPEHFRVLVGPTRLAANRSLLIIKEAELVSLAAVCLKDSFRDGLAEFGDATRSDSGRLSTPSHNGGSVGQVTVHSRKVRHDLIKHGLRNHILEEH